MAADGGGGDDDEDDDAGVPAEHPELGLEAR